jgi:hypothetical protein
MLAFDIHDNNCFSESHLRDILTRDNSSHSRNCGKFTLVNNYESDARCLLSDLTSSRPD